MTLPHFSISSATLTVTKGRAILLLAFDVGFSIDLAAADRLLAKDAASSEGRGVLQRIRRSPRYFAYNPAPLRVARPASPIPLANTSTAHAIEATIFDFGAVSLSYSLPILGTLPDLLHISESLYENESILADARARLDELLTLLAPAIRQPAIAPIVEDYAIFQIEESSISLDGSSCTLDNFLASARAPLAAILRAESTPLSTHEIDDALASRLSYSTTDAALIDFNAAILFDPTPADATAALEFANVELLEMRFLDDRLDQSLETAYTLLQSRGSRRFAIHDRAIARVAQLQADNTMLFEGVNNALKLLGDQHLARLYRLATNRFHLPEWDQSVLRKLSTIDSIYQKLADRATVRRMEILEWIIILLIAFEIVMSLIDRLF
ncbi:MAG: hypothetical protein IPK69_09145 [Phycisphaerales bacterium]|nr:MAG: hypothetical protein IPK69_09145 [Phycisphaerales bacterium]